MLRLLDDFERDLLSAVDGTAGRLRASARAKTAIPPAVLPSVEHALLESFPLGTDRPPTATTLAVVSGYRPDQVRQVLDRLAADALVARAGSHGWSLTAKGHRLRAMLRSNGDLGA